MTNGAKSCDATGRRSGLLVGVLLAATVAMVAAAPARAEDGPYPVWWSPKLELESLGKIDERLARPIWADGTSIELATLPKDGSGDWLKPETWIRTDADNCRDLLALVEAGYDAVGGKGITYPLFLHVLADCRAIRHLKTARPARLSFVRDFQLDERAPAFLPSLMSGGGSCEGRCKEIEDNERGIPLGEPVPASVVTRQSPYVSTYEEGDSLLGFEIVGIADFDGDGVEDLLVENFWGPSSRPVQGTDIFLIERSQHDEVFHVPDVGRYFCPDYSCRP